MKKRLGLTIINFNEKLQNIFEIGSRKHGVIVEKSATAQEKNIREKNSQTGFCCFFVKIGIV